MHRALESRNAAVGRSRTSPQERWTSRRADTERQCVVVPVILVALGVLVGGCGDGERAAATKTTGDDEEVREGNEATAEKTDPTTGGRDGVLGSGISAERVLEVADDLRFIESCACFDQMFEGTVWDGQAHVPVTVRVNGRQVIGKYGDIEWVTEFAHRVIGLEQGQMGVTEAGELFKIRYSDGLIDEYVEDFAYVARRYRELHRYLSDGDLAGAMSLMSNRVEIGYYDPVLERGPLNLRAFDLRRDSKVEFSAGIDSENEVVIRSSWYMTQWRRGARGWLVTGAAMSPVL